MAKTMDEQLEAIERAVIPVLETFGVRLVDLVFRQEGPGRILRLLIESRTAEPSRGSGVTVDTCARVSRDLSIALDALDLIEGAYVLEVSSAGLDRPLKSLEDFSRFAGSEAVIKTREPVRGSRAHQGRILGVGDGAVRIGKGKDDIVDIPFQAIARANLVPDLPWKKTGGENRP